MGWTVATRAWRAGWLVLPFAALSAAPALVQQALAQQYGYPPSSPPAASSPVPPAPPVARNPVCLRLEGQLAAVDRDGYDPTKAEQIRRNEEATAKQQAELDRLTQQAQRQGCQNAGFFSMFSGQSPQCIPLNSQIQQVRSNLNYYLGERERLQGSSGEREGERRGVLAALAQNDCGP